MVVLEVDQNGSSNVHLELSGAEVCGALNWCWCVFDLTVPIAQIKSAKIANSFWEERRGARCPGTGIPGVIALGTGYYCSGKEFWAAYGTGQVISIEFNENTTSPYAKWIFSVSDENNAAFERLSNILKNRDGAASNQQELIS